MGQEPDKDEMLDLKTKLLDGKGTLEEAEQWITRLKEIDPYFESSDMMLSLFTPNTAPIAGPVLMPTLDETLA
jgi:hypothetical protein